MAMTRTCNVHTPPRPTREFRSSSWSAAKASALHCGKRIGSAAEVLLSHCGWPEGPPGLGTRRTKRRSRLRT
eukprot:856755-Lingulodinium_polyedra.AAC.1